MRGAVFALTETGLNLAKRVLSVLGEGRIYGPKKYVHNGENNDSDIEGYEHLGATVALTFSRYDALVFIMAAGIVVRLIAPLIKDKLHDPAVIVMDEECRHVISLLSGHVGGANLLTNILAKGLKADPVITTATDTAGKLAPDLWAGELGLYPWPKEHIRLINGAMLKKLPLYYGINAAQTRWQKMLPALKKLGAENIGNIDSIAASTDKDVCKVIFSEEKPAKPAPNTLYLLPRPLIAGVGCRRGVRSEEILTALREATAIIGQEAKDIRLLTSTEVKSQERGLLAAADFLACPLKFFANDELNDTIVLYGLKESIFVKKTIGVGNVAEAAALSAGRQGRLLLGKTKWGKVTVALVWPR